MIIKGDGILFLFALNIHIILRTTIWRESMLPVLSFTTHNGRQNCHATSVLSQAPPPGALYTLSAQISPKPADGTKNRKISSHQEVKQVSESLYL